MNFIDISSWQSDIDLETLFKENPLDGVIIKATEATGYVNPKFKTWAEWLLGKHLWGTYHFCTGEDAIAEAKHFFNTIKPYIGKMVPCADYEKPATNKGTAWLKEFLDEFARLSGIKCLVYCSQSVTQEQNFNEIAKDGYRLWVAQYADFSPVYGFLDNPWHSGSVSPFMGYQMQQYTSCGVLKGWTAYLDFDKFFGTENDWNSLCGQSIPAEELKPVDPMVVSEVLMGRYGIGTERIQKLCESGYDPESVQKKINELYSISNKVYPIVSSNLSYLNSIMKIVKAMKK